MLNSIIYTERNVKMAIFQSIANKYKDFKFKMKTHHPSSLEELKALVEDPRVKLSKIDVSKVESFEGLFKNSTRTDFSGIEKWDVSHVTNMRQMFYNCKNFNADISRWNVSNVSAMAQMFYNCKEFSQDLHGWDMSGMKGHLNGQFLSNMFKNADKMTQRVIDAYVELGKQNIPPEERFSKLPIPRPKDYKKLVVPHTDSDVKEMFERIEDFANMDTSAVHNLDGVLKGTKKKELKNGEDLDFSNVKSANDFLKDAKNFNMNFTFDEGWRDLKYANNFMSGTDAYNQPVPPMPNVCQMDHFMADNKNFKNDLHSGLKDSKTKFADESFNKVDPVHMVRETSKLSKNHAVTKAFAERIRNNILKIHEFENKDLNNIKNNIKHSFDDTYYGEYSKNKNELHDLARKGNVYYLQMPTETFNELKRKAPDFPGIEFYNIPKEDYRIPSDLTDPVVLEKIHKNPDIMNTSLVVVHAEDYKKFIKDNPNLKIHNSLATVDEKGISIERAVFNQQNDVFDILRATSKEAIHDPETYKTVDRKISFRGDLYFYNDENFNERAHSLLDNDPDNKKIREAVTTVFKQIYDCSFQNGEPVDNYHFPRASDTFYENLSDFRKYEENLKNKEILKKDNSVKNEVKASKIHGR